MKWQIITSASSLSFLVLLIGFLSTIFDVHHAWAIGCYSLSGLCFTISSLHSPHWLRIITTLGFGLCLAGIIDKYALLYQSLYIIEAGGSSINDYPTCLYFSIVTLTTLGYGDLSPSLDARGWAASEALIGYIFLGLFVSIVYSWAASLGGNDL